MKEVFGIAVIGREERNAHQNEAKDSPKEDVKDIADHAIEKNIPDNIGGFAPLL
jgi:hypothetical protein